jgi:hypothetical protein
MSWDELDNASVNSGAASKQNAEKREKAINLAKAYSHCFATDYGQQVIMDLSNRFIYINDTSFNSPNINYEAAYHDGEAGVIKFIINQIKHAELGAKNVK